MLNNRKIDRSLLLFLAIVMLFRYICATLSYIYTLLYMYMRHLFLTFSLGLLCTMSCFAQIPSGTSNSTMVFDEFHPAVITMNDGQKLSVSQANIFLKGSVLLYKNGKSVMAANMDNISKVDIDGSHFMRIDTLLAEVIDTIGQDLLLCATVIDVHAFKTMLENSREITNLEIRDMVSVSSIDLIPDEDKHYPLAKYYFYFIDGKALTVNERSLATIVPKDKRRIFKSIISFPDFSWGNPQSLKRLLKAIR